MLPKHFCSDWDTTDSNSEAEPAKASELDFAETALIDLTETFFAAL